jgi:hypothetical protein
MQGGQGEGRAVLMMIQGKGHARLPLFIQFSAQFARIPCFLLLFLRFIVSRIAPARPARISWLAWAAAQGTRARLRHSNDGPGAIGWVEPKVGWVGWGGGDGAVHQRCPMCILRDWQRRGLAAPEQQRASWFP